MSKFKLITNPVELLELFIEGYRALTPQVHIFDAADFGVPQHRQRAIIVALQEEYAPHFHWPLTISEGHNSVGKAIGDLMAVGGWPQSRLWARRADVPGPTIVGGSKKHGGADLGPSRTRAAWKKLGVEAKSLGDGPPPRTFTGLPRLTIPMVQRLQGFPDSWQFAGGKTESYRQVGNALPPPLAEAVAWRIRQAVHMKARRRRVEARG